MISTSEYFELSNSLSDHDELFYTMWNLGKPSFTEVIPTAAVGFDSSGKNILYMFNPSFYESLSNYEKTFIIAHESLHVILNHGSRLVGKNFDRTTANIAQDLSIHELMFNMFNFDRTKLVNSVFQTFAVKDIVEKTTGLNLPSNASAEAYYEILLDYQKANSKKIAGELDDHSFLKDGEFEISDIEYDKIKDTLQEILKSNEGKNEVQYVKKDDGLFDKKAGNTTQSIVKIFKIKRSPRVKWERIITDWVSRQLKIKLKDQWAIKNPRLNLLNETCMLPYMYRSIDDTKSKKHIFLFQDTSGSCVNLAERFLKVAQSIPEEHFTVRFFCFDTQTYETDYKKGELKGFGGTRFDILEEKIQDIMKEENIPYPKAIFVITDGYGNLINPEKPERWSWILSEPYKQYIPKECITYDLKDFD